MSPISKTNPEMLVEILKVAELMLPIVDGTDLSGVPPYCCKALTQRD